MVTYVLLFAILSCVVGSVSSLKCYECNVWKTGYGQTCEVPRIRKDCTACMKFSTTISMGYYKNRPRTSTITSRVCARSRLIRTDTHCDMIETMGGYTVRCYCDDDLCNAAPVATRQSAILLCVPLLLVAVKVLAGVFT